MFCTCAMSRICKDKGSESNAAINRKSPKAAASLGNIPPCWKS